MAYSKNITSFSIDRELITFLGGLALSSILMNFLNDLYFNRFDIRAIGYSLFVWGFLRISDSLQKSSYLKKYSKIIRYSISNLIPISIILLFGALRIDFPMPMLSFLFFSDLLYLSYFHKKKILKKKVIPPLLLGALTGLVFYFLGATRGIYPPWFHTTSLYAKGSTDSFRDLTIINSWYHYGAITHAAHGLKFTPYHCLSALFHSPFLSFLDSKSIIHLQYFAYLMGPLLFNYLAFSLFSLITHPILKPWRFIFIIISQFTFLSVFYFLGQRSVSIGLILAFIIIPIIIQSYLDFKISLVPALLLTPLLILMLFARAFHGLVLLCTIAPIFWFDLVRIKKISINSILILLSCISGVTFSLLFYGPRSRNSGINLGGFFEIWKNTYGSFEFITGAYYKYIALFITIILIAYIQYRKEFLSKKFLRLNLLFYVLMLSLSIVSLKTGGSNSDYGYTTVMVTYLFFFTVLHKDYVIPLLEITARLKHQIRCLSPRAFNFVKENIFIPSKDHILIFSYVTLILVGISLIFKIIPKFQQQLKEITYKYYDPIAPSKAKTNYLTSYLHLMTNNNIYTNMNEENYIYKLGKIVDQYKSKNFGKLGVYISPINKYWDLFPKRQRTSPIFLSAVYNRPMIFGVKVKDDGLAYEYLSRFGAINRTISEIGGKAKMCDMARKVHLDSILIFANTELDHELIFCK